MLHMHKGLLWKLSNITVRCRVIQRVEQPIILTGYQALNKLLGRPVYTSQLQLGGPRVMAHNGVSHHIVQDDLEGVKTILQWLAFVPPLIGTALSSEIPVITSSDPEDRDVTYEMVGNKKFNAREAIAGSGSFLAEISVSSPRKLFIFII